MSGLFIQNPDGSYSPVNGCHQPHVHHGHWPGYHAHGGANPYPVTHSYGVGIPGGSAYGYVNIPHGAWLGSDWIGLERVK